MKTEFFQVCGLEDIRKSELEVNELKEWMINAITDRIPPSDDIEKGIRMLNVFLDLKMFIEELAKISKNIQKEDEYLLIRFNK